MKVRIINAVLCKKFDDWAASIEDANVRELVQKNTIITGGCIASMLLREKVNDFDMYFRNMATSQAVAEYYISKFKENPPPRFLKGGHAVDIGLDQIALGNKQVKVYIKSAGVAGEAQQNDYQYFETLEETDPAGAEYVAEAMKAIDANADENEPGKPPYRPVFLSSNAITLSDKVQIVLRFYGEPGEIHENYDFVHCTNYWDSKERKVFINAAALEALLTRELRYVGSLYPLASVIRTRKFINRGWTVNAGQYLKMLLQCSQLDLSDINVLQDQLTGVDAAYFNQMLTALREKGTEKVDAAYLTEIIDRMF